jgi:AcrR family transcriptional regulator
MTARVAERTGVSIGSLYQYFPNKAAILFRLQSDEWRQTNDQWHAILGDTTKLPCERLRQLVQAFVRSECDEATIRSALDDAAPLYRDAPEAHEARADGDRLVEAFMREVLPHAEEPMRELVGDLIFTTLSAAGKSFSETRRDSAEIDRYADAMADMFCAYLRTLNRAF